MAKKKKKGKSAWNRKFAKAAKSCKGSSNYKSCMSQALSGGSGMSQYYGMDAIEDFSGIDGLGQVAKEALSLPSREEFMTLLISGGGAGAAFFGMKMVDEKAKSIIPFGSYKTKSYIWTGLKMAAAIVGGRAIYKYSPNFGSGFAVGMMLSVGDDILGYTGLKAKVSASAEQVTSVTEEEAAVSGWRSFRLPGLSQVDIEEQGRLAQVDIEEKGRLAGAIYGYRPQLGLVDLPTTAVM